MVVVFKDARISRFLLHCSNGIRFVQRAVQFFGKEILFQIYLWSRNKEHAIGLQSKFSNAEVLNDLNDVRLRESDVICTCTASEEALIGLKQVKNDVHINGKLRWNSLV